MPDLTEDSINAWLAENKEFLTRAIEKIERLVKVFIEDWGSTWEFRVEQIERARIKDARRILAKATRRELSDPDELLQRCYVKDGRNRFPVQDLLGVRILVLGLNEVAALKTAVEDLKAGGEGELYPLGNPEDFDLEDINESPRESGYRALHIDGSVTIRVGETDYVVPFELQVKTLAQHVHGQHTHDEAYVPDEANEDPRYRTVRELHRALAESLNAADLLLAQIEDVAGTVRDDIARREAGPEVSPVSVTNVVREKTGLTLRDRAAAQISDHARAAGLTATEDFAALIDPTGDPAAALAEAFKSEHRRGPSVRELVDGLVDGLVAGEGELEETRDEKAALEAELAKEPPLSELDELDPHADVLEGVPQGAGEESGESPGPTDNRADDQPESE